MAELGNDSAGEAEEVHHAASSLFDLRTVIALLFGVYGLLLLIIGIVDTTQEEIEKSGGLHMNVWSGVVMLVVAALFFTWMRLRPARPPETSS
ncbi:hypothetical protein SAMN05443637_11572 [Pseudonocardia thermophila]|uniref:Uncharacterized protein n=1 Tax=Pseudonocardia thermophila TaxID=1848 RepID=A0A1M6WSF2_PSETH|nr:hypothetical protein SAMN05443637_11572 [Pseudonocardia thermophila]